MRLLYGNLDEVYNLISSWDKDKIINAYLDAPQKGFNTQLMGRSSLLGINFIRNLKKGLDNRDTNKKVEKMKLCFYITCKK